MTRLLLVGSLACGLVAVAAAQSQQPVFRGGAERVRVDVVVTDRGKPVAGLKAEDFEITDNGTVAGEVELSKAAGNISVAIALDLSGSVERDGWQEMLEACRAVADALESKDSAWLLTFSDRIALKAGPVRSPVAINRALNTMKLGGGSSVWDAMFGVAALASGQSGRSLALLLSDGADTTSYLNEERALDVFRRSEVAVTALRPRFVPDGFNALERAADATGGTVLQSAPLDKVHQQVTDLITEYRLGYVLTYRRPALPTPKNRWHEIDVKLKKKRGEVRAREGYYEPVK